MHVFAVAGFLNPPATTNNNSFCPYSLTWTECRLAEPMIGGQIPVGALSWLVMKTIIGVMGPGKEASGVVVENAFRLGALIAENNWVVLSGGMANGVMGAVNKGAKSKGGLTIGVLPNDDPATWSSDLDVPIVTNMKAGRNYINALSCRVMVACGIGPGTASELSFAVQAKKPIVLLSLDEKTKDFFESIGGEIYAVNTPEEAVEQIKKLISKQS